MAIHQVPSEPVDEEAFTLFRAVEEKFPSKSLGSDKWYIVLVGNFTRGISHNN